MFGGDERGPPFLRCLIFDAVWSGFDDELLEKFAREPSLPLTRAEQELQFHSGTSYSYM